MNRPIANQQHGIGRGVPRGRVERERLDLGSHSVPFLEHDLYEGGTRARSLIESERSDLARMNATVQLHAQHRPPRGDAGIGDDDVILVAKCFDGRNQRNIESAGSQIIGQPTGDVEDKFRVRNRRRQSFDEGLGVEISNGSDAYRILRHSS